MRLLHFLDLGSGVKMFLFCPFPSLAVRVSGSCCLSALRKYPSIVFWVHCFCAGIEAFLVPLCGGVFFPDCLRFSLCHSLFSGLTTVCSGINLYLSVPGLMKPLRVSWLPVFHQFWKSLAPSSELGQPHFQASLLGLCISVRPLHRVPRLLCPLCISCAFFCLRFSLLSLLP